MLTVREWLLLKWFSKPAIHSVVGSAVVGSAVVGSAVVGSAVAGLAVAGSAVNGSALTGLSVGPSAEQMSKAFYIYIKS